MKQPGRLDFSKEGGPTVSCGESMSKGRGPYRYFHTDQERKDRLLMHLLDNTKVYQEVHQRVRPRAGGGHLSHRGPQRGLRRDSLRMAKVHEGEQQRGMFLLVRPDKHVRGNTLQGVRRPPGLRRRPPFLLSPEKKEKAEKQSLDQGLLEALTRLSRPRIMYLTARYHEHICALLI